VLAWSFVTLATEQLSLVVGVPRLAIMASHEAGSAFTFTAAGQVILGFCVSVTETICVQVAVEPLASVTVHRTVVEPIAYVVLAWSFVTLATEQLSLAVGVPRLAMMASHEAGSAFAFTAAGQVIVGFCVSVTVTIWLQVAVKPLASVAVHLTVVEPIAYVVLAWSFVTLATEQLSAVVGVPTVMIASHEAGSAFTFTAAGQVILGFCVSVTVTICVQVAVKPLASVTVQMTVVEPIG
jgi:hypothetical protein